jgi:hypothetical protein
MITALNTSSESLTAETFHTEVFWVVAPCSLVYTSVAEEQFAFIFTVEVRNVSLQLELLYAYALILSPINSTNFTPYTP